MPYDQKPDDRADRDNASGDNERRFVAAGQRADRAYAVNGQRAERNGRGERERRPLQILFVEVASENRHNRRPERGLRDTVQDKGVFHRAEAESEPDREVYRRGDRHCSRYDVPERVFFAQKTMQNLSRSVRKEVERYHESALLRALRRTLPRSE